VYAVPVTAERAYEIGHFSGDRRDGAAEVEEMLITSPRLGGPHPPARE
jgi:hypothetical protein